MIKKIIICTIILCVIVTGLFLFVLFLQPFHTVRYFMDLLSFNGASSFTENYYQTHSIYFTIVSSLILIMGIISFFLRRKLTWFTGILADDFISKSGTLKKSIIVFFKEEPKLHSVSLLIILSAGILNRIICLPYPFRYDEALTYYSFIKTPFLFSIANYSYPNNHIFHTILVQFSTFCFGDSLTAIRLPAFLAGIFILPLTYVLARKIYNKNIGLISTAVLSCSFTLVDFSVNARGYTLICFFFVLLLLFSLKKNRTNADRFWITLISSLGFYTIPVFLYPFIIFLLWTFLKEGKPAIKDLIIYSAGTCISVIILYTPVLLYTGLSSLTGDEHIYKYNYDELPKLIFLSFINAFSWLSRGFGRFSIYFGILGLILGLFAKNKKASLLLLSSITVIWVISLIYKVVPPNRVLLFLLPAVVPYLINGLFFLIKKENIAVAFSLWLMLVFSVNININKYYLSEDKSFFEYDKTALQLKNIMLKGDRLIAKLPVDYPLEYYLTKYGIPFSFVHVNNGGFSADSTFFKNVFVIVDKRYNRPQELYYKPGANFIPLIKGAYIEVYQVTE